MAEPKETIWELDPHTAAKHVLLRKYLNAWLPIITRWNGRVIFCDGFAGPGIYKNGEDGSPIIALRALLEHSYLPKMTAEVMYLFIEEKEDRCESLNAVVKKYELPGNVKVNILNNTYEEAFTEVLDYLDEEDAKLAPTLAFIDPFGIKGLPLKTIVRLMEHEKCEVLVTIMVGFIYRFISTPEFKSHCDALFGTDEWRKAIDLKGPDREQFLRNLYHQQLLDPDTGVGAQYARYFTMKNEKNKTIYDLFFATNSYRGIDAMKNAMWKVDQSGGYTFSDATNPEQEVLFTSQPNWDQLIDILIAQFGKTTVAWPDVVEAIRQSPFRILKTPLKAMTRADKPRIKVINPEGARAGVINDSTQIQFVR